MHALTDPRCLSLLLFLALIAPANAPGDWLLMDPPPDVDKYHHGHSATLTCCLATSANMLAGAGYGTGSSVQEQADGIYLQLVDHFGTDE